MAFVLEVNSTTKSTLICSSQNEVSRSHMQQIGGVDVLLRRITCLQTGWKHCLILCDIILHSKMIAIVLPFRENVSKTRTMRVILLLIEAERNRCSLQFIVITQNRTIRTVV